MMATDQGIRTKLLEGVQALDERLDDKQLNTLLEFIGYLDREKASQNITAIEFSEAIELHLLDSLSVVKGMSRASGQTILDLGTGAGLPGIPLSIIRPDSSFTLLDSTTKKVAFLEHLRVALGLPNVRCLNGRAEELGRMNSEYRASFNVVVSRAVASLPILIELAVPFLKIEGILIAMKSKKTEDELSTAQEFFPQLGVELDNVIVVNKFFSDLERKLVIIRKITETPSVYPRSMKRMKRDYLVEGN